MTAWSIKSEARYKFLDGPGILPMDDDKKPKSEGAPAKEAKADHAAQEVKQQHGQGEGNLKGFLELCQRGRGKRLN